MRGWLNFWAYSLYSPEDIKIKEYVIPSQVNWVTVFPTMKHCKQSTFYWKGYFFPWLNWNKGEKRKLSARKIKEPCRNITYVMYCAIWYHLYNLKNVKNTNGGVFFTFFKLHKWYQIAQRITYFEFRERPYDAPNDIRIFTKADTPSCVFVCYLLAQKYFLRETLNFNIRLTRSSIKRGFNDISFVHNEQQLIFSSDKKLYTFTRIYVYTHVYIRI